MTSETGKHITCICAFVACASKLHCRLHSQALPQNYATENLGGGGLGMRLISVIGFSAGPEEPE